MPLPLIPIIGGAIVAAAGGTAIHGAVKMKNAGDDLKEAQEREKRNLDRFKQKCDATTSRMENLGKTELQILSSFQDFSHIIEKFQHRPDFAELQVGEFSLPNITVDDLKEVSIGAVLLTESLADAAKGSAAGLAAKGVGSAAIKAIVAAGMKSPVLHAGGSTFVSSALAGGTSAAGSALAGGGASLASSALLGGGASVAGSALAGSGATVAGGSIIATGASAGAGALGLGVALGTLAMPIGILVGGITFNISGSRLADKADKAQKQVNEAERQINTICKYLDDLKKTTDKYHLMLRRVDRIYQGHMAKLKTIVYEQGKTDWRELTPDEIQIIKETTLLVAKLYAMCKVQLVIAAEKEGELNKINHCEAERQMSEAEEILSDLL